MVAAQFVGEKMDVGRAAIHMGLIRQRANSSKEVCTLRRNPNAAKCYRL